MPDDAEPEDPMDDGAPMTSGGWLGPYDTEDEALEACGSDSGSSDSTSGSGICPDNFPTTLYLVYSCENCECRTTEVSEIHGPIEVAPHTYVWGYSQNNCGADAQDYVFMQCEPGDDGQYTIPGPWTFVHSSGYDTVGPEFPVSTDPLIVDFGQYRQQGCDPGGGPCNVTLTA